MLATRLSLGFLLASIVLASLRQAEASPGVYLSAEEFLQTAFDGGAAEASRLIVDADVRDAIERILGHSFPRLRLRYWQDRDTTAWILEEIGKTEPITIGVSVKQGRIRNVRVLEFRESRGWEIRYPFFTDQFRGARLDSKLALDRPIDGITGATLSVAAMNKVVRIALLLDQRVRAGREAITIAGS